MSTTYDLGAGLDPRIDNEGLAGGAMQMAQGARSLSQDRNKRGDIEWNSFCSWLGRTTKDEPRERQEMK